jgi:hypothetical protein
VFLHLSTEVLSYGEEKSSLVVVAGGAIGAIGYDHDCDVLSIMDKRR